MTIFSSRIKCGCCGGWYGSKTWHSNDRYRRVIWQCNSKFKDRTWCKTPHLTEDEIKEAFVSAVNKLITDRTEILNQLRNIQSTLFGTEELEAEQQRLAVQMNVDFDAVNATIAENARKVQNQDEYNTRFEMLSARAEESKAQYNKVTAEITMRSIRQREFDRFIKRVEELPQIITGFDEALWSSLVDHITVYSKDNIVFTLNSGMEIKA